MITTNNNELVLKNHKKIYWPVQYSKNSDIIKLVYKKANKLVIQDFLSIETARQLCEKKQDCKTSEIWRKVCEIHDFWRTIHLT